MKARHLFLITLLLTATQLLKAQRNGGDSLLVVNTMKELINICKSVDFSDPQVVKLGTFYKAAAYIVYRGKDKKRAWKEFANYKNAEDKKGVDETCLRINESINRDNNYKVVKYSTEKESEGTWYILLVTYKKKGIDKKAAFAFLKIGNRFGLGDID